MDFARSWTKICSSLIGTPFAGAYAPVFIGTVFALRNRRKSLCCKGLRRRGAAPRSVSPCGTTTYINKKYFQNYSNQALDNDDK